MPRKNVQELLEKLAARVDVSRREIEGLYFVPRAEAENRHNSLIKGYINPLDSPSAQDVFNRLLGAAKVYKVPVRLLDETTLARVAGGVGDGFLNGVTGRDGISLLWTGNYAGMAATLAHELSHAIAHFGRVTPGASAETEAEAAAFVILDALGLDRPESAFYIANSRIESREVLAAEPRVSRIVDRVLALVESFDRSLASYKHKDAA